MNGLELRPPRSIVIGYRTGVDYARLCETEGDGCGMHGRSISVGGLCWGQETGYIYMASFYLSVEFDIMYELLDVSFIDTRWIYFRDLSANVFPSEFSLPLSDLEDYIEPSAQTLGLII